MSAHPQWTLFGLAVALACQQAASADLPSVTAEEVWLSCGSSAKFGHPLSCGRLPVAVAGVACLISQAEVERYFSEFRQG